MSPRARFARGDMMACRLVIIVVVAGVVTGVVRMCAPRIGSHHRRLCVGLAIDAEPHGIVSRLKSDQPPPPFSARVRWLSRHAASTRVMWRRLSLAAAFLPATLLHVQRKAMHACS